jgi:sulfatase modifying factor 1
MRHLPVLLPFSGALALAACGSCGSQSSAPGRVDAGATDATVDAGTPPNDGSGAAGDAGPADASDAGATGPCPAGMVLITSYCIDRWEAYVVAIDDAGNESPHSPYDTIDGSVRAKTAAHVVPQGYISQVEATQACNAAGKRLCSGAEFRLACEGPDAGNWYPYGGETRIAGYCNADKGSEMPYLFGNDPADWTYADFNDPRLNQIDGGLSPTASYPHCESPYGIFDCVGNLHEWGNDPADSNGHGRFRGGFYGDATENGPGCLYVTSAHALAYHDYSTGFRCCADASGIDAGGADAGGG